ncbi:MAG: cytochrome c biogenesis protein ResB [Oscillospiraceae bacterium]|nr:cytochrome c biogenesis protein ResB [Oscillospiraceae bacterium]
MKKTLTFLRSMRFGLLLLLPVLVCSVLGSIVPQGEAESYYASVFPGSYHLILGLGLDHVFRTWVFLALTALFGVNLLLCSISQYRAVPAKKTAAVFKALRAEDREPLTAEQRNALEISLKRRFWQKEEGETGTVYTSPAWTWYGSVITHFAIFGILLGAAGIFGMSRTADYEIMPGENRLPGNVSIRLDDFKVRDDSGRIDYVSTLEITDASGRSSGVREIRVNKPLRFGSNKYYQQTYGAAGTVHVSVKATGEETTLFMREPGMISAGGKDGVWYDNVYPGYVIDEAGNITVIPQTSGEYADPVYYFIRIENGVMTPMMAFPGDRVEVSDAVYTFSEPVHYPGIRVKTTPVWIYALLYLSFAALIAGLYLCFFASVASVSVEDGGWSAAGKGSEEELRQRINAFMGKGI